jgi:propanediol dehydratase small subunit
MPWCTPYVFEKLYAFPESWKSPPNVYVLDNEPERHNIFKENGQWFYREPWQGGKTLTLVPENTILLVYNNNEMQRHFNSTELISINDTINFKAVQASRTVDYERRKLYNYLLERKSAFHY